MSKFRLAMARRLGEKITKERGFDRFPIDPVDIARRENISVEAKPPDRKGVSGGIIFHDDEVIIFYATNIKNAGFQRFTIGHELGHYFLPGHPEEITKIAPVHVSRAGFSQGAESIEIEADHFSSGLLMPSGLVRGLLTDQRVGLDGIAALSEEAQCSLTASAIRAAECSEYPMAVIISSGEEISYGFLSDSFKDLHPSNYPRKGDPLPHTATREFNLNKDNVLRGERICGQTTLADWLGSSSDIPLDEEIIGLGKYGYTLTVLSSDELPLQPYEEEDEEEQLLESWTPRFAYNR